MGGSSWNQATEITEGMVVLDAVLQIQAEHAPDLAVRWNCKAECPQCIAITDNAIIPLKERVADVYYDPIRRFFRRLLPKRAGNRRGNERTRP